MKIKDTLKSIGKGIYDTLVNIGFLSRPIGIVGKDYEFIYRTLTRNIGNANHEYDGYGTPIGQLADPYFNLRTVPWFLNDVNKNSYANYLEYIKKVYSSTLSVTQLTPTVLSLNESKVGVITDYDIIAAYDGALETNVLNDTGTDTELGFINNNYLSSTLINASNENSLRKYGTRNITSTLPLYVGLNDDTIDNINNRFKLSEENGRVNDVNILDEDYSPLYDSNYGIYNNLGVYNSYLEASSEKTQDFILKSLTGTDLLTDFGFRSNKRKYYVLSAATPNNYISAMVNSIGTIKNVNDELIGFDLNAGNTTMESKVLFEYAENGSEMKYDANPSGTFNHGVNYGQYNSITSSLTDIDDLLNKTNQNFIDGKYRTLISRFHTNELDELTEKPTQTAISHKYGMSMGRNLRKLIPTTENGYDNPYCRVWTYHHQYSQFKDLIRPLFDETGPVKQKTLEDSYNWSNFRANNRVFDKDKGFDENFFPSGGARLDTHGVKNLVNGLVNITPTNPDTDGQDNAIKVKNCMFSIENLAWKGMFEKSGGFENGLSDEQKGPFGGRIMWFPPYDISFSENVSVNWSSTSIIGRGENIYTYTNTERSGQLHFKLLVDHPSILNYWSRKYEDDTTGDVDDITSKEQELLRFFAGCGIISAGSIPKVKKKIEPKPIETKPNIIPKEKRTYDKTFTFFVFYPNNYSGIDDKPNTTVSAMEYLINGVGSQMYRVKNASGTYNYEDLPTTLDNIPTLNGDVIGGYEMRIDKGISTVTAATPTTDRFINTVQIGGESIDLVTNLNTKTKKQWYYRVDKRVATEILRPNNYIDSDSFGLNSSLGYKDLLQVYNSNVDENNLYSFSDVFVALTDGFDKVLDGNVYNSVKVSEIKEILSKYKIKEVHAMGVASSHGYTNSNNILNKNRAQSVMNWLKTKKPFVSQDDINFKVTLTQIGNVGKEKSVSNFLPKLYRAAQIEVTYQVEELVDVQATMSESFSADTNNNYVQTNYLMGFKTPQITTASSSYNPYIDINGQEYSKKDLNVRIQPIDIAQRQDISLESLRNKMLQSEINILPSEVEVSDEQTVRYDNENRFFQLLATEDPIMHHKITDKIKYFDPAFHSISPEGFNARLNFLHQCTRQGSTISASDSGSTKTANNLAFGRPPVCILRIGDFYYTKIIIDSLSIDYDPLVWDLNTEGIGVQPMIANVNIWFKFIGGSDLAGPIARLQNALSFNSYANTGVYDNRSEMAEYDEDNKITKFKAFK
jgi:hypothetical protein